MYNNFTLTIYYFMKPEQLLHNWNIKEPVSVHQATSGLLNVTYIVRTEKDLFILQKVHPAVSMDGAIKNYFHVTRYLNDLGMISQLLLPTVEGKLWIDVAGERWRMLRGVEGEVYTRTTDVHLAEQAGIILAQTDLALKEYPKELYPGRRSHQYQAEIGKLQQNVTQLEPEDKIMQEAAQIILTELPEIVLPEDLPQQIIHTDPKVSNFLFTKDGQGICMIDFDTLQILSPLYDICGAIRSWCGQEEDDPTNTFKSDIYRALLSGYLTTSKGLLSEREQELIPLVVKQIILGLTTRFLNDYIEDKYFGWDASRYDSRKAHNRARVIGQLSLYQTFLKSQ